MAPDEHPDLPDDHRVFQPIEKILVQRQAEISELVRLACSGLQVLTLMPELGRALKHTEKKISDIEKDAMLAKKEVDRGFSTLFAQALISAWGALETAVRDLVITWLSEFPSVRNSSALAKIKIRLVEYESLTPDDRMRYLLGELERELGASLQPGIGRFESILSAVSLGGEVDNELQRNLLELASIRNVLVHRLGIVDQRFVSLCPWLKLEVGSELNISHEQYNRYLAAIYRYAIVIVRRAKKVGGKLAASVT